MVFALFVLLAILSAVCLVLYVYYESITSWFVVVPSDEADDAPADAARVTQAWLQKYLSPKSAVLQVQGNVTTVYNVQKLLEDPSKHIVMHTSGFRIEQLRYMQKKHRMPFVPIQGELAQNKKPVSIMSRNYATEDYEGKPREVVEAWQQYTFSQLETLYGIKVDTLLLECDAACAANILKEYGDVLKQFRLVVFPYRFTKPLEEDEVFLLLQKNHLQEVKSSGDLRLWMPIPKNEKPA